ncbi:hypothetical protein H7198_01060 [Fructobacillus sp. CRL 2054]|uniref:hypothetical protein n=1 Tax=Fructobacillus sp. CRL 2054 TaxID=2763007 RepID=UPI0023782388|nr:hypothetical protein [Fructobacillus sp. CRL 2054]MDD9138200.1 hypothetical protein [Fructobacillus sp. CRL 2054]
MYIGIWMVASIFAPFLPSTVVAIAVIVGIGWAIIHYRNKRNAQSNQVRQESQAINERLIQLNDAKNDAVNRMNQLPVVSDVEQLLPSEFRNEGAVADLFKSIYENEADSIKEGIRVVRDNWHRAKMEGLSQQMLDEQRRSTAQILENQRVQNAVQARQLSALQDIRNNVQGMADRDRERFSRYY